MLWIPGVAQWSWRLARCQTTCCSRTRSGMPISTVEQRQPNSRAAQTSAGRVNASSGVTLARSRTAISLFVAEFPRSDPASRSGASRRLAKSLVTARCANAARLASCIALRGTSRHDRVCRMNEPLADRGDRDQHRNRRHDEAVSDWRSRGYADNGIVSGSERRHVH